MGGRAGAGVEVRRRILVVEDDDDVRGAMAAALEDEGYDVACAVDGWDALRRLNEMPTPDLVVTDLMMPSMDGWELLGRLENDYRFIAMPVVVLSAAAPRALPVGQRFVLGKPVKLDELLATVQTACERTREDGERAPSGT
jgi:CheY-like chemotaxis protein